jgi:hypothetical protein
MMRISLLLMLLVVVLLLMQFLFFIAIFSKTVIVTRTCITATRWEMLFIGIAVPIVSQSSVTAVAFTIAIGVLVLVRICASYLSVFASTLDALVTVLVQTGKIRPQTPIIRRHDVRVRQIRKPNGQVAESCCMEFILM